MGQYILHERRFGLTYSALDHMFRGHRYSNHWRRREPQHEIDLVRGVSAFAPNVTNHTQSSPDSRSHIWLHDPAVRSANPNRKRRTTVWSSSDSFPLKILGPLPQMSLASVWPERAFAFGRSAESADL